MECLTSVTSDFGKYLVRKAVNELRYPCCFNNIVEDRKEKKGNLISRRNDVEDRVKHATKQAMKSAGVLNDWLKDAETEISNGGKLLKKARTNKRWCFGHCPNWFWRYRLGKNLAKKKSDIEKFTRDSSKYIHLERIATLPSVMQDFPSEECLEFDSRQSAYKQLMEAVKNDEVTLIGLYGMGGCGKTILAKQVAKKAEHLFDKVLLVPVSSTVDVGRIQDKIASSLSFKFPENEEREKAQRLRARLTLEKRILLILDDVWEKLDFGAIGIPLGKDHRGSKVLITTRSVNVCTLMDCELKITLSILTNEEAWTLFQKEARICESTSVTIQNLAREISNECLGLPVAIAAVAATLKGKADEDWYAALDRLKNSKQVNIEKGLQNPYKCLQLSYDNLDTEEAKSLFLLCSVFPEDYEIPFEFLGTCAIGLGLVGEVSSYEKARNEVIVAKNKLISSCLLLDVNAEKGGWVKMHDLVRDVAHWIAKDDSKVIKCALGKDVKVDSNSLRYLWCDEVPNQLDCSNLEFLCICTKLEVPDEIFKGMRKLRVLLLYNIGKRRPLQATSFKSLTNLRLLLFENWELNDISFVEDIKTLESLEFTCCSILDLPNDDAFTQLSTKLRVLQLNSCDLKIDYHEVIGRFPQLEELYFIDENFKWDVYNTDTAEFFNKFSVPQTLERYAIKLGAQQTEYDMRYIFTHRRTLLLGCYQKPNEAFKDLAKKAEVLYLANIEGDKKNIIPDIFKVEEGGDICELGISDSKEVECLVDTRNHWSELGNLFSKLVILRIERMEHLGALWHGHLTTSGLFGKLRQLYLRGCPELKSIFTPAIALRMVQLEKLEILECDGLKHILADDDTREIRTDDENLMFSKLKWIEVGRCKQLEYVIPITFAQNLGQLEILGIQTCEVLKYIFGQCTHGDHLADQSQNCPMIELSSLKILYVSNCDQLEYIIPASCAQSLIQLESMEIGGCGELKYIFNQCADGGQLAIKSQNELKIKFPALKRLFLWSMPNLISIFPENYDPSWPCLRLNNCPEFATTSVQTWLLVEKQDNSSTKPCFPKLATLFVQECHKLKYLIPVSVSNDLPNLGVLIINGASELEELFKYEQGQNVKVELPKLKLLIFIQLSSLCQGTELQTVRHRVVHNCSPKLSLTSTTTFWLLRDKISDGELEIDGVSPWDLYVVRDMIELAEAFITGDIGVENPTEEAITSGSELSSSQIIEESYKEFIGEIPASEIPAIATLPTNSELIDRPSPSLMDIQQHKAHSQELVDGPSMSEPCLMNQLKPLGEIESTAEIPQSIKRGVEKGTTSDNAMIVTLSTHSESATSQSGPLDTCQLKSHAHEWDSMPETTSQLQLNHEDPATSVIEPPSSQVNGTNQSILSNLAGTIHEHNQIESGVTASESYEFLESVIEIKGTPHLQLLEQKLSPISLPNLTESINETETAIIGKDPASVKSIIPTSGSEVRRPSPTSLATPLCKIPLHKKVDLEPTSEPSFLDQQHALGETISVGDTVKGIIQAGPTPQEAMKATLSAGIESDGLSTLVVTDTHATGRDIRAQEDDDSIEAPPPGDSADSHSLIIGELGAYKHLVDLDDAQIALLAEAIAVYPHLWNVCGKFSERFQAWMLKTLADMLLFLRNESAVSVTSEREKEFHRLCDEAVQLGFERSWVDEMRQRVMVRDPGVDHAQAQLTELLKRQDQLTRELWKIKGEINSLNDFVDSKKKCFDFL